ncbi:MAG: TraR/DksA family transcriptional regulator [Dactylosporangium sp.]|nr:TraR/DksA family transcriptional regulator [Dactylosporangium sp.]NNJ59719.1 TraR/DksA family transcriptional regulator [Dactylosporangium sp.]
MLVKPEHAETHVRSAAAALDRDVRAERIRAALLARRGELATEHSNALANLEHNGGIDAGDDAADLGAKALAREHDLALLYGIQTRLDQVDRALERLATGRYGWCEWCSQEIPVARLVAFPAATQCVRCKQLEERR